MVTNITMKILTFPPKAIGDAGNVVDSDPENIAPKESYYMAEIDKVVKLHPKTCGFEDWWALQVHKTGKLICKAKWDAITRPEGYHTTIIDKSTGDHVQVHLQATPEEILEGQRRQNKELFRNGPSEDDKQFLKRPQQWLNQGGWLDG